MVQLNERIVRARPCADAKSAIKIDGTDKADLIETVSYLRRIISLLLLTVWFAAAQYCSLAAAGVLNLQDVGVERNCCSGQGPCENGGCTVVERGAIPDANTSLKAPMPALHQCACLLCAYLLVPVAGSESAVELTCGTDKTHGWVPT